MAAYIGPDEYLQLERAAEFRSGYYDGQMYAMPASPFGHGIIIGNLIGLLGNALDETPCRVVCCNLRVRVSPEGLWAYPDVLVVCESPRFVDDHQDTLLNPTLIIEVLSKKTEERDRGLKASEYRKIDSLREYVLVSQEVPHVEVYARLSSEWGLTEYNGTEQHCRFESIGCSVQLAEIYWRTDP